MKRRSAWVLAGSLTLVCAAPGCGASSNPAASSPASAQANSSGFDGAGLPPGVIAPPFSLSDQNGATVSLASYRGRVAIVAFVYSACGSPCVVIAQQIRGALDELDTAVPVVLVSVDPATDTPERVRRFLTSVSLSGRVSYLTGSAARLRPVWRAFGVTPASAGRAAFARTAPVYLIDRAGHERVVYQLEQLTAEGLAHDARKLLG
jgi:protein SCO1/2